MLTLTPTLNLDNLASHMIFVKGDTFKMGSNDYSNERPIHKVHLDDYYLCRYPVSQQLWYEVMESDPEELMFQHPHRPVERVSWEDITNKFLTRLGEKTGKSAYCLPTEAEWEYAARGGMYRNKFQSENLANNYTYAGSDVLKEVAWNRENSYRETHPIALKRPNQLGLYGMSGNVFEWCQDRYDEDYYQQLKDQYGNRPLPNPKGPEEGDSKVVRGGSWIDFDINSRVSNRNLNRPSGRSFGIGFRLCWH